MNRIMPRKPAAKAALAALCLGSASLSLAQYEPPTETPEDPPVVVNVLAPSALNVGTSWPDYAKEVQSLNADASPGTAPSHINDYRFQPDQLNVLPGDGNITVLRTDQKILVTKYITKVFTLTAVNPREIINGVRVLVAKEGGRAEVLLNGLKGTKGIQVICPEFQLPYIEAVVAALDQPWVQDFEDGSSAIYYKAKHRDINHIDAVAFDAGTPDQSFRSIDTKNNAVYYHDDEGSIGGYKSIVDKVDVPAHEALIDVTVYEVTEQDDLKLGLDYVAWKNGPGRNLFRLVLAGFTASEDFKNVSSIFDPFVPERIFNDGNNDLRTSGRSKYLAGNYMLTSAFVDFLAVEGKARVMTGGQLLAKSGTRATFERVDQLVAFNPTFDEDSELFGRKLDYSLSDQETGFFLEMVPYIGTESMEADITVDLSTLSGVTPQGMPMINHRTVASSAVLRDSQPYVIGGLKLTSGTDSKSGMPFLKDIPVLGYAFGGKTKTERENRVIVVLKPKMMIEAGTEPALMSAVSPAELAELTPAGE